MTFQNKKIGVFDSGVGGKIVANKIMSQFPDSEVIFVCDEQNVPYGTKTIDKILELSYVKIKELSDMGCDAIVVACNTVTTNCITELRAKISTPLIGMEPMVKPASQMTKNKVIGVCATPATLASKRYHELKDLYANGVKVTEPDCSDWALMIETNSLDRAKIKKIIEDMCEEGVDVIVLGCTHYHWIEDIINEEANGRAKVIQPEEPVISQLKRVLEQQH